jgi:hypothetical protein
VRDVSVLATAEPENATSLEPEPNVPARNVSVPVFEIEGEPPPGSGGPTSWVALTESLPTPLSCRAMVTWSDPAVITQLPPVSNEAADGWPVLVIVVAWVVIAMLPLIGCETVVELLAESCTAMVTATESLLNGAGSELLLTNRWCGDPAART